MGSYDWIVPVIFLVIWTLVRFFRRGEEEKDLPSREETRERAREIQEEIRRRIAERGRGADEGEGVEAPPVKELTPVPTVWAPRPAVEEVGAPVRQMESIPEVGPARPPYQIDQEFKRPPRTAAQEPAAVWVSPPPPRSSAYSISASPSAWRSLRLGMKRPRGLKEAFIYAEALGTPLALRRRGGFMQFWDE